MQEKLHLPRLSWGLSRWAQAVHVLAAGTAPGSRAAWQCFLSLHSAPATCLHLNKSLPKVVLLTACLQRLAQVPPGHREAAVASPKGRAESSSGVQGATYCSLPALSMHLGDDGDQPRNTAACLAAYRIHCPATQLKMLAPVHVSFSLHPELS